LCGSSQLDDFCRLGEKRRTKEAKENKEIMKERMINWKQKTIRKKEKQKEIAEKR